MCAYEKKSYSFRSGGEFRVPIDNFLKKRWKFNCEIVERFRLDLVYANIDKQAPSILSEFEGLYNEHGSRSSNR